MEWRCSCGLSYGEEGDGQGWLSIKQHQMGKTGHKILGLFESEDPESELLVPGSSKKAAVEGGYMIDPRPAAGKGKAGTSAASAKKAGTGKLDESNVDLGVMFAKLRLPPAVWGWIALTMPELTDDEGQPLANDNEGIGQFIYECVEFMGRYILALKYRREMNDDLIRSIANHLRNDIRSADVGKATYATVPDIPSTNTEDILSDIIPAMRSAAHNLADQFGEEDGE